MKEKLYTIPVNDAFNTDCECPLCAMYNKLESDSIDFTLGASYMEEDIRDTMNLAGFCATHYNKLYAGQNRLGLALMTHTHLLYNIQELNKMHKNKSDVTPAKKGLFSTKITDRSAINTFLDNQHNSCYVCDRIDKIFYNYVHTIFHLYKIDSDFATKLTSGKGFCLHHFNILIEHGQKFLSPDEFDKFYNQLFDNQLSNLQRLHDELAWFIDKFDYRNNDKDWGNSRDSLNRTINKLSDSNKLTLD